jgi:hypothetical protein
VVAAVAVAFVPRRKTPLQLAALTGALLVAFQFLLTHWSALYLAWFLPFVYLAVLGGESLGGRVAGSAPVQAQDVESARPVAEQSFAEVPAATPAASSS